MRSFTARQSREHDAANVICLGERVSGPGLALESIHRFLRRNSPAPSATAAASARCSRSRPLSGLHKETDMTNHLREIEALGQAVWLDNISRAAARRTGARAPDRARTASAGVTSNPTIFEKAIGALGPLRRGASRALAERALDAARDLLRGSAIADIRDGRRPAARRRSTRPRARTATCRSSCRPSWPIDADGLDRRGASDSAARSTAPNVLIKVPGTATGVRGVRGADRRAASTSTSRCCSPSSATRRSPRRTSRARARASTRASRSTGVASVASFFVSRVDGKVDAALEKAGPRATSGARPRWPTRGSPTRRSSAIFSGERWEALAAAGARVQRPLWASTSTKNPDYPDTLYVDELIGPGHRQHDARRDDRGRARPRHAARTVDRDVDGAHR